MAGSVWILRHGVTLGGLLLIIADVIWRAHILSHLFFRQDDFQNLDLAFRSKLSWHYLSFIGSGDFMMGQRLIDWFITRGSLYNWPLASAVILVIFAFTALAALRLLHTLFGTHPGILVPLALFLLSPLTVPSFGWLSSGYEELPVQLALFMALDAHIRYVRGRHVAQLAFAAGWVAFGLFFYEKGLVIPLLLFAITAAYFAGRRSFLSGAWFALIRYRWAWLSYLVLLIIYSILLAVSLRTAIAPPRLPHTFSSVVSFVWHLLASELLPGALGGPWKWLPVSGSTYAIAAAPSSLAWLATIVAIVVVAASVVRRKIAWRAWAIWIGWVALADMLPVIIRRLNGLSPVLYAAETRYVADAIAVLTICLGLAFLPLIPEQTLPAAAARAVKSRSEGDAMWRRLAAGALAMLVVGSIVSTMSYSSHVSGRQVADYIANAREALRLAPAKATIVDRPVPGFVVIGAPGPALTSRVLGDMSPGRLRWISEPKGTIDSLRMFGPDGRLHLATVQGGVSPWGKPCYPTRRGRIVVNFWTASPSFSQVLRVGYLWYSASAGVVNVRYGPSKQVMVLRPGLHAGYLLVHTAAHRVVFSSILGGKLCVGEAGAGYLVPDYHAPALPRISSGTVAAGVIGQGQGRSLSAPELGRVAWADDKSGLRR